VSRCVRRGSVSEKRKGNEGGDALRRSRPELGCEVLLLVHQKGACRCPETRAPNKGRIRSLRLKPLLLLKIGKINRKGFRLETLWCVFPACWCSQKQTRGLAACAISSLRARSASLGDAPRIVPASRVSGKLSELSSRGDRREGEDPLNCGTEATTGCPVGSK
jgi:L-fucose isomerase-like protein